VQGGTDLRVEQGGLGRRPALRVALHVLHLFAQLLDQQIDQQLEFERGLRDLQECSLRFQPVGLAI
jgi:hypothetical protein